MLQALGTIWFRFLQKKYFKKFHACVPLIRVGNTAREMVMQGSLPQAATKWSPMDLGAAVTYHKLAGTRWAEAEFLNVIGTKVSTPPPPPPLQKWFETICNGNIVSGNLKSENPQDYAQKSPCTKLYVHVFGFWENAFLMTRLF